MKNHLELSRRDWLSITGGFGLTGASTALIPISAWSDDRDQRDSKAAPKKLSAEEARICVTGFDHNRPDRFPGLGDFIGWAEAIERMPNGDILLAHSAGRIQNVRFADRSVRFMCLSSSDSYLEQ